MQFKMVRYSAFSFYEYLSHSTSDHSPMLVHMISKPGTLNYWQDTNDFQSVLIDAWSSQVGGSMLFQITKKLKILRVALKK